MNKIDGYMLNFISSFLNIRDVTVLRVTCRFTYKSLTKMYECLVLPSIDWSISVQYSYDDLVPRVIDSHIGIGIGLPYNMFGKIFQKNNIGKHRVVSLYGRGGNMLKKILDEYETCKIVLKKKTRRLSIVDIKKYTYPDKKDRTITETCDIDVSYLRKLLRENKKPYPMFIEKRSAHYKFCNSRYSPDL